MNALVLVVSLMCNHEVQGLELRFLDPGLYDVYYISAADNGKIMITDELVVGVKYVNDWLVLNDYTNQLSFMCHIGPSSFYWVYWIDATTKGVYHVDVIDSTYAVGRYHTTYNATGVFYFKKRE